MPGEGWHPPSAGSNFSRSGSEGEAATAASCPVRDSMRAPPGRMIFHGIRPEVQRGGERQRTELV
jgi:hypothetical protein